MSYVFRVNLHFVVALMSRNSQGLVYEACDYTHMPLHMPKTLEMCKKSMPCLIKKLQGVWQIAHLKQQRFLSFTFYKTQRSYKKIMCIYLLFHWFSGEDFIMFLFSLLKGWQTLKELKRNMNDGTVLFLTSLLIVIIYLLSYSDIR